MLNNKFLKTSLKKNNNKYNIHCSIFNVEENAKSYYSTADWDAGTGSNVLHYEGDSTYPGFASLHNGTTNKYEVKLWGSGKDVASGDSKSWTILNWNDTTRYGQVIYMYTETETQTDDFKIFLLARKKSGASNGSIWIYVYGITASGSDYIPTGGVLCISDTIELEDDFKWVEIGGWQTNYTLNTATRYAFVFRVNGNIEVAYNSTGGYNLGNGVYYDGSSWSSLLRDYYLICNFPDTGTMIQDVDFGSSNQTPFIFYYSDSTPGDSTTRYTIYYSTDGSTYVEHIHDAVNGELIEEQYRYWRIKATLTAGTTKSQTPILWEYGFKYGNHLYAFSNNEVISNSEKSLLDISNISNAINFRDFKTKYNKCSLTLLPTTTVKNLIKNNYWLNFYIIIKIGIGTNLKTYINYYSGYLDGYQYNNNNIIFSIADPLKFLKGKVPSQSTGAGKPTALEYGENLSSKDHVCDVIIDIIQNAMNTENRIGSYSIDFSSFNDVKNNTEHYFVKASDELKILEADSAVTNYVEINMTNITWNVGITDEDNVLNGLIVRYKASGNEYYITDYDQSAAQLIVSSTIASDDRASGKEMEIYNYDTSIKEPVEARKLIEELLKIVTSFIIYTNGNIKLKRYDSSASSVKTWYDRDIISINQSMSSSDFINEVGVWYGWRGNGDSIDSWSNLYIDQQATSQSNWHEQKRIDYKLKYVGVLDKNADGTNIYYNGQTIAKGVAEFVTGALKNGALKIRIVTSLAQAMIEVGDFVTLDTSLLAKDIGSTKKCFILKKDYNLKNGTISWDLMGV